MQTALQIGMEYSERLQQAALGYEELTGHYPSADGDFWDCREIQKLELLSMFWWSIARMNNPTYEGNFTEEYNNYEENRD